LDIRTRANAWFWALVEVTFVWLSAQDGAHGTDIETEQATANNGDCRDDIDLHSVVGILEMDWRLDALLTLPMTILIVYQMDQSFPR
jgi:hypothetical protein